MAAAARKLKVAEVVENKPVRKPSAPRVSKAEKEAKAARLAIRRKLAAVVGGIGVVAIGLSVVHCTDAISALTGSHWGLSGMLALAIDAGMVTSELAELLAHDDQGVKTWARRYVIVAVAMSMILNAYAFAWGK
jgi:negative regulator of sigma E activity